MLVLTRKQGEKIRIGKDVTITVIRMKGKAIRLGIEAPHDLSVLRGELCDREAFGQLVEQKNPTSKPADAAAAGATTNGQAPSKTKTSPRPEQMVGCVAWSPEENKPQRTTYAMPGGEVGGPAPRRDVRPLQAMVERRARASEGC